MLALRPVPYHATRAPVLRALLRHREEGHMGDLNMDIVFRMYTEEVGRATRGGVTWTSPSGSGFAS